MIPKIIKAEYSQCGHINFFMDDGQQVTIHKKDVLDCTISNPEVKEEVLRILIKLKMRPILLDALKTQAQKWATIQDAIKSGVALWE